MVLDMIFAQKWLDEKAEDDPEGRTNREIQTIVRSLFFAQALPTNAACLGVPPTVRSDTPTEAARGALTDGGCHDAQRLAGTAAPDLGVYPKGAHRYWRRRSPRRPREQPVHEGVHAGSRAR